MRIDFHHVAVAVSDMDRSVRFYRDLLDFRVAWDMDDRQGEALSRVVGLPGARTRMVMLEGHGGRVELFQYHHPLGMDAGRRRMCDFGITHFALSVRGIQDLYERLAAAGVQFNCPPLVLRPGVTATYMKGPDGETVELIEYAGE